MYVSKIRMQNFRCYTDFTMHFSPGVTVSRESKGAVSSPMMSVW